jgi:hypothetical protein
MWLDWQQAEAGFHRTDGPLDCEEVSRPNPPVKSAGKTVTFRGGEKGGAKDFAPPFSPQHAE